MRTFDEIVADAQKTLAASLHEAFEAGRAHTATELKARMVAFFDGLVSIAPHSEPQPAPPSEEQHHSEHHG